MVEPPVPTEAVYIELPPIERNDIVDPSSLGEQNQGRVGEVHRLIAIFGDQSLDRLQIRPLNIGHLDPAFSHPGEEQQLSFRTQQVRDLDNDRPSGKQSTIELAEKMVGELVKRIVAAKPSSERPGINDRGTGHAALP